MDPHSLMMVAKFSYHSQNTIPFHCHFRWPQALSFVPIRVHIIILGRLLQDYKLVVDLVR